MLKYIYLGACVLGYLFIYLINHVTGKQVPKTQKRNTDY